MASQMRFHWRLMLISMAVIALAMAAVHLYLTRTIRDILLAQRRETLTQEVRMAVAQFAGQWEEAAASGTVNEIVNRIGRRLHVRATVIDGDGKVLWDSEVRVVDLARLANQADRPEVRSAWEGSVGRHLRSVESTEREMQFVAKTIPGLRDGRVVMRLGAPLNHVEQLEDRVSRAMWAASALGLALALLLSYNVSQYISRPIEKLTRVARSVAAGNFDEEVPSVASSREFRDLARALDSTRQQVRDRIADIVGEKSRLETILSDITVGILVTGRDGRVLLTNHTFEQFFGVMPPTEGRPPVEMIRDVQVQEAIEHTLRTGEARTQAMTTSGLPERHFDVHVGPIRRKGAGMGVVAVFYDTTELHRLERARKDFVANVSHEIRTPLTAIKGCADTLAEGALEDRETAERFVQTILAHSDRLQLLLEDLLDLSRLQSDRLAIEKEDFSIRRVVDRAYDSIRQQADDKGIGVAVTVQDELTVRGDPKLIEQAVVNLLDNAVKYTPQGGQVRVAARRLGTDEVFAGEDAENTPRFVLAGDAGYADEDSRQVGAGESVALEVVDTGIGIASDALPRVFERFYRVDKGRSRSLGGTGLGLSIVRHIIEAHGERVYAKSVLGAGATFGFTLPIV